MFLQLNFKSKELRKLTTVNVLLPDAIEEDKPYKTLWLFHGIPDDQSAWMRFSSIERYAKKYNLAVVMPNADRCWYTNTAYGINYFNFITEELPTYFRSIFKGMSDKSLAKITETLQRVQELFLNSLFFLNRRKVVWEREANVKKVYFCFAKIKK